MHLSTFFSWHADIYWDALHQDHCKFYGRDTWVKKRLLVCWNLEGLVRLHTERINPSGLLSISPPSFSSRHSLRWTPLVGAGWEKTPSHWICRYWEDCVQTDDHVDSRVRSTGETRRESSWLPLPHGRSNPLDNHSTQASILYMNAQETAKNTTARLRVAQRKFITHPHTCRYTKCCAGYCTSVSSAIYYLIRLN